MRSLETNCRRKVVDCSTRCVDGEKQIQQRESNLVQYVSASVHTIAANE